MANKKKEQVLKNRLNVLGKRAKTVAKVVVAAATLTAGGKAEAQGFGMMMPPPPSQMSYGGQGYHGGYDMSGGGYCERPQYFGRGVNGGQMGPGGICYSGGMQHGGGAPRMAHPQRRSVNFSHGGPQHFQRQAPCGGGFRRAPAAPQQRFHGAGPCGGGGRMIRPRRQGRPF